MTFYDKFTVNRLLPCDQWADTSMTVQNPQEKPCVVKKTPGDEIKTRQQMNIGMSPIWKYELDEDASIIELIGENQCWMIVSIMKWGMYVEYNYI